MEAIVEFNYVAQEPDELSLKKGEIIKEIKVMLGGWWEGTLRDKRGMFPDNFVKVIEPSSTVSETSGESPMNTNNEEVTLRNGSGKRYCKVLYSYEPCNEDELALVPQESIEYLGEVEEGWWKGMLRGRVGVFPSNFVSSPLQDILEVQEKLREKETFEYCQVLFPYKPDNEDELTLIEGDIVKIISKDAFDKGWWKGELRGQVGLFPDNFVKVVQMKNENQEQRNETDQSNSKSLMKNSVSKKVEKGTFKKTLETKTLDSSKKPTSQTENKRSLSNNSVLNSLKRFVSDGGGGSGNHTGNGTANTTLGEELDGVERGEGTRLSHLTASRAKAPRRRPPSSKYLRNIALVSPNSNNYDVEECPSNDNLANGDVDKTCEQSRENEDETRIVSKIRRKVPWMAELKLNQEKRKNATTDRPDKCEVKKEKRLPLMNLPESNTKSEQDHDDRKLKDKERNLRIDVNVGELQLKLEQLQSPTTSPKPPAFVPYNLYNELLERVALLEEKYALLQATIGQLNEKSLLGNASTNNKA